MMQLAVGATCNMACIKLSDLWFGLLPRALGLPTVAVCLRGRLELPLRRAVRRLPRPVVPFVVFVDSCPMGLATSSSGISAFLFKDRF